MCLLPTQFDIWFITELGKFVGRNRLFDLAVESGIRHYVLGGFWFAASVFVYWIRGAGSGGQKIRIRILTTLFGSLLAIGLTFPAAQMISHLPPSRSPGLAELYPDYLTPDINTNSFPSQSAALDTAVALGILSLDKIAGSILLLAVPVLVSFPRLYLGGHYPIDVGAGLLLGLIGFLVARLFLEKTLSSRLDELFTLETWPRALGEFLVFIWMFQVAVDFGDVVWIWNSIQYFLK